MTATYSPASDSHSKPGQNSLNQAKIAKTKSKGDKRTIFTHVSLFCFSHTHVWMSPVLSHAIALNIGIIIIFIKCNHKLQCLIKKFISRFSRWYFKFQICYLFLKFTIIVINDQVAKTNQ